MSSPKSPPLLNVVGRAVTPPKILDLDELGRISDSPRSVGHSPEGSSYGFDVYPDPKRSPKHSHSPGTGSGMSFKVAVTFQEVNKIEIVRLF